MLLGRINIPPTSSKQVRKYKWLKASSSPAAPAAAVESMDVDNTVDLTPSRKVRDVAYAAAAAANSRQSMQRNINATTAAATLPSCSTVRECLDSLSRHVWDLDLRPMQLEVLLKLFSVENKMKKLLETNCSHLFVMNVVPTGKALIYRIQTNHKGIR